MQEEEEVEEEEQKEGEESQKEYRAGLKTWRFQICNNRLEITWCDHLDAETYLISRPPLPLFQLRVP